jgi:hypothetical protein
MRLLLVIPLFTLASCASVNNNNRYGFLPRPGMTEDSHDYNTKYNLMDSPDGSKDPNGYYRVWGATY